MRELLRDLYFGNIVPSARQITPNSNLQREVDSIIACENFILGLRLGVRLMAECMDEDDGDTQKITDGG